MNMGTSIEAKEAGFFIVEKDCKHRKGLGNAHPALYSTEGLCS
jgi:hypothetical protein